MKRLIAAAVCVSVCGSVAMAQCDQPFTVDLFSVLRAEGEPTWGDTQNPFSAWKYGDMLVPLSGVVYGSGVGAWGNPTQPFMVPLVGPVCSPDPLINRELFFDRPISFNGVFLHPGYPGHDLVAAFNPRVPVTLTAVRLQGEVFGDASNGVLVRIVAKRSVGSTVTIIPQTLIPFTHSGSTTLDAQAGTMPMTLNGDNEDVVLTVNSNAIADEDWFNGQVTLTMTGGPVIFAQPKNSGACQHTSTQLKVYAAGSGTLTYTWQKAATNTNTYSDVVDGSTAWGSTVSGAHTDTLDFQHAGPADGGKYRVIVSNGCRTVVSYPAVLTVCVADYDCSGFVDTDDFTAFVHDFEEGVDAADVDGTGFVDTDDFTYYVLAFEAGC